MPLSKEFYLDEIRSKHPNSYNDSLKDLPIKDLADMLDFLDEALGKADGGSIGIEVLFGPKREEYQTGGISVGGSTPLATYQRQGYQLQKNPPKYDSRATAQDFANALQSVSAGTTYQQQADAKRYARQEANRMLTDAFRAGNQQGLQNLYNQFGFNASAPGSQLFSRGTTSGTLNQITGLSAANRDRVLDQMAQKMLNTTSYAAPKPRPKTYRTVSPEAQALNMSQATYEDIIRSGKDPKQYYMDYQNRIMAGNPNLLKYGQVIGGPGGPGLMGGATPPTQAQINQMMQSNPMGYMDFADLVKTYSADPYKGLKEEIKDMVDGRDTGYMSAQDYYDVNVLGLDGKGIAEKYGLQYADGGRVGLFMGGPALEGTALNIYNSMSAYGFTDQQIADALQGQGLYTPSDSSTPETTAPNIINQQIQSGGGGGGITELQKTFRTEPGDPKNFRLSQLEGEADYFPPTTMMGKAKNFLQELSSPQVRGTLGTRMANQPKLPIPSFASFLSNYTSPFNIKSKSYNPLLEEQLNFAETQEGIIGRDPNSGLLKYGPESVLAGKNVISMFGTNDYEKMLQDYISKMNANKKISAITKAAKLAQAQKELEELQKKTEAARAAQYGAIDYGRGSDGQRSYSGDAIGAGNLGFGIGATTGGPVSNRTGRGRTDYSKGGLATMFKRKR
jgi:hypothetical protein